MLANLRRGLVQDDEPLQWASVGQIKVKTTEAGSGLPIAIYFDWLLGQPDNK
jgi:hypothetical protein